MEELSKSFLDEQLQVAREVASIGARIVLDNSETREILSSVGRDIKLLADKQSDEAILKFLQANSPHQILSEESGENRSAGESDFRWIVDPLDGSFNFQRGLPIACVSAALWRGKQPVLGVIRDFQGLELWGVVGQSAHSNRGPISVSQTQTDGQAALATGLPVGADYGSDALLEFSKLLKSYKKIRMLGSAAMSLAFVAQGILDVYHEKGGNLWDVAGGIPIVIAAGGKVAFEITENHRCWIVASNGKVGGELFATLSERAKIMPSL